MIGQAHPTSSPTYVNEKWVARPAPSGNEVDPKLVIKADRVLRCEDEIGAGIRDGLGRPQGAADRVEVEWSGLTSLPTRPERGRARSCADGWGDST